MRVCSLRVNYPVVPFHSFNSGMTNGLAFCAMMLVKKQHNRIVNRWNLFMDVIFYFVIRRGKATKNLDNIKWVLTRSFALDDTEMFVIIQQ